MEGIERIQPINRVSEVAGVAPVGKYWVSSSPLWEIRQAREILNKNAEARNIKNNYVEFKDVLEEAIQRRK